MNQVFTLSKTITGYCKMFMFISVTDRNIVDFLCFFLNKEFAISNFYSIIENVGRTNSDGGLSRLPESSSKDVLKWPKNKTKEISQKP